MPFHSIIALIHNKVINLRLETILIALNYNFKLTDPFIVVFIKKCAPAYIAILLHTYLTNLNN